MTTFISSPATLLRGLVVTALALLVSLGLAPGAAHAEDGYRYWNYSHLDGDSFSFAETGPGDFTPEDGDVEGWRFGTSTVSQGIVPRADLGETDFEAVCGAEQAGADEKRVAVLLDYGTPADAAGADASDIPDPRAACAVVPADATGQQVLGAVAEVRGDQGLICALDGYPVQGCGEEVADAEVAGDEQQVAFTLPASADQGAAAGDGSGQSADGSTDAAEESDSGVNALLVAAVVLVALLLVGGLALARRRRDV